MIRRLLSLPGWLQITGIIVVLTLVYLVARPVWGFLSCPFGLCTTKAELRAEIADLRGRFEALEAESRIARVAIDAANRTDIIERTVIREVEAGREEIKAAAASGDFDALYAAYRAAVERVWRDENLPSGPPNSREGRPAHGVRAAPAGVSI